MNGWKESDERSAWKDDRLSRQAMDVGREYTTLIQDIMMPFKILF